MEAVQSQSCVGYYRVSTRKQGISGLGLEAQQHAVRDHLDRTNRKLIAELIEVESGKNPDRPKLAEALKLCRLTGAKLIVARLDRLARNVAFVSRLMESGADFEAVDFPQANRFTVHILAAVAEYEARLISERTRAGLAAARARGVKLGGPGGAGNIEALAKAQRVQAAKRAAWIADLTPVIKEIQAAGFVTLSSITRELNARGIRAPRGGRWRSQQLWPVLSRLSLLLTARQSRQERLAAKLAWITRLAPVIAEIQARGRKSSMAIASELNARGLRAYWGGRWLGCQVLEVLRYLPRDQRGYLTQEELIERLRPIIREIRGTGISSAFTIARELNARRVCALLGGRWRGEQVQSLLVRLATHMNLPRSPQARSAAMHASKVAPVLSEIQAGGCTSASLIASEMNSRGVPAYLGGQWSACQVRLLIKRLRLRDAWQRLVNHRPTTLSAIESENAPPSPKGSCKINCKHQEDAPVRRNKKKPRNCPKPTRRDRCGIAARNS